MSDNRFHEHLRLTLLRFLSGAPGYRANSSILHTVAKDFGLAATRDQIKVQLGWLKEQDLITSEEMADIVVATLTARGLDVAEGHAACHGVQRPTPRG